MSFLTDLIPINISEEREKVFADPRYNPQFRYSTAIDEKALRTNGTPKPELVAIARNILEKTFFGRNEDDLDRLQGPTLSQDAVHQKIQSYLEMHGLQDRYQLVWSSSFITRTTITKDAIKLRLPAQFRKINLQGMLYHEIGTHALRRVNYEQQPWFNRKQKYEFGPYLRTEEGLASLHSLLPHQYRSAYVAALRYLAVHIAQNGSFSDIWRELGKYFTDKDQLWRIAVRQKRGQEDTRFPGGYSKDLVYFEGMLLVWQWLHAHNFDCTDLYLGKLGLSDVEKAVSLNPDFEPLLPSFFTLNKDEYAEKIAEIGKLNEFPTDI